MVFEFTAEQEEFRQELRRFLQQRSGIAEVRKLMDSEPGYDVAVWKQMAVQLGLQGLLIPEHLGGSGLTFLEVTIAFEEMGRVLLCAPFFSTVALASSALLAADDSSADPFLLGIAAGTMITTLATSGAAVSAKRIGHGHELDGALRFVVDGHLADVLLVVAESEAGPSLFAVTSDAAGLSRQQTPTLDRTRRMSDVHFSQTPAALVGRPGDGARILDSALTYATVALAAEQVGGAQACLDMAVEYAKSRVQFGRAIGSFQAVKHLLADTLLEVESARSAARYAAWAIAEHGDDFTVAASLAKAVCSEAYLTAATNNLQIHGGIGFTWEVDCHLYLRRAKSSEIFLGSPFSHRDRVASYLGL
jgi:alkylation response protein AidB-like acyl-CoA dehydrogenase